MEGDSGVGNAATCRESHWAYYSQRAWLETKWPRMCDLGKDVQADVTRDHYVGGNLSLAQTGVSIEANSTTCPLR